MRTTTQSHPFTDAALDSLLGAIVAAANAGARAIREGASRLDTLEWQTKGAADYLSEVDTRAEAEIAGSLRTSARPSEIADAVARAPMLGEESWTATTTAPRGLAFVIDPLDGTTNFLHGVPHYAVSIAAVFDGTPIASAVYDVTRDETFTAIAGRGSRLGERPISVSPHSTPARALIGTGFPFGGNADVHRYARQFMPVAEATAGIRRCGSAAIDLAWVAAGRLDAFWELSIKPWDIAAGILLIAESGGVVTGLDGNEAGIFTSPIVAGNRAMHEWLIETLNRSERRDR